MSLNGYAWVEGDCPNEVDPSGHMLENQSRWDNCDNEVSGGNCPQSTCSNCSNECDPCATWGTSFFSGGNSCYTIERDPCFEKHITRTLALSHFTTIYTLGPVFGYGGEEFKRSMGHYASGQGGLVAYGSEWYLDAGYTQRHVNALYNWFVTNYGDETYGPLVYGPQHCAKIFVGRPNENNDVFFTFGRHFINGCFRKLEGSQIEATFTVHDRFDFDPTLCTVMPSIQGLNPYGCIPHRWWWQLAQNGEMAEFDQIIAWNETVRLDGDFSDRVDISQYPGCTRNDALAGAENFCPEISAFDIPALYN